MTADPAALAARLTEPAAKWWDLDYRHRGSHTTTRFCLRRWALGLAVQVYEQPHDFVFGLTWNVGPLQWSVRMGRGELRRSTRRAMPCPDCRALLREKEEGA